MSKGSLPAITIHVEEHGGRKKSATVVAGMRFYGVEATDLAKRASKKFACRCAPSMPWAAPRRGRELTPLHRSPLQRDHGGGWRRSGAAAAAWPSRASPLLLLSLPSQVVVIQGNMQSRVPDLLRAEYNIGSKFVSIEAKRKAAVKKRGRGGKR